MKYRIEPKPEGKARYCAYLETESLDEVKAWVAQPPVPTETRVRGTDGTYRQLTTPMYRDIIVREYRADGGGMDDNDNVPMRWMESRDVSTVASMETEAGCRQIEAWSGKPVGSLAPRPAYDR